jgi:lipopolysaccharide export system permease protein
MKILDRYLLKTFATTLATVFTILFFIFILQTVWLFISELAGKDLDFIMVLKFLLFSMPRIIPLVLPLSILLASIMTFGDLSENYEFAAMKSSGISLQRAMKSLIVFMCFLSVIAFIFANNVIPYAEYKFINFRKEIAQRTPAMAIAEGQFSKVGNFSIKVEKKSGKNGNFLKGITIHKKTVNESGNKTVIRAKTGELVSNDKSNYLQLVLFDGYYYEDIVPKNYEDRSKLPFGKSSFKRYVINIDLTLLNKTSDQSEISRSDGMLTITQLKYTIDSLNRNFKKDKIAFADNSYLRTGITNGTIFNNYADTSKIKKSNYIPNDILKEFTNSQKTDILKVALSNLENSGFSVDSAKTDFEYKQKNINVHWISLYEKFVIGFACILMFFIGAPLGSIIRKGGLGLPIVFAVIIFIIYHFTNTFGKRVAAENGMPAILGAWISTLIMTPLAVLLTYRAIKDIGGIMNFDAVTMFFQSLFPKANSLNKKINEVDQKQNLIIYQKQYQTLSLIAIALSIVSFVLFLTLIKEHTTQKTVFWILINLILYVTIYFSQEKLEHIETIVGHKFEPGKTVTHILGFPLYGLVYFLTYKSVNTEISNYKFECKPSQEKSNSFHQIDNDKLKELKLAYKKSSLITLITNIASLLSTFYSMLNHSKIMIGLSVLLILAVYILVFLTQNKLEKIEKISSKKFDPEITVSLILAFPLYILIYFLNHEAINKINK